MELELVARTADRAAFDCVEASLVIMMVMVMIMVIIIMYMAISVLAWFRGVAHCEQLKHSG